MNGWMRIDLTFLQWVVFAAMLLAIAVRYGSLRHRLFYLATHYVPPTVFVLLVYALLLGGYGTQYGIPNLFWHDHPVTRLVAAISVTLLFAVVWIRAFYADPEKAQTQKELRRFLGEQGPPPAAERIHVSREAASAGGCGWLANYGLRVGRQPTVVGKPTTATRRLDGRAKEPPY